MASRVAVVGGGIVGLAVARQLVIERPGAIVTVLEKEDGPARHQTGHNSGVVHAGIYYRPGSLKAALCVRGKRLLAEFCQEHGIAYRECGKLIVALGRHELPRLADLHERGLANGVPDLRLVQRSGITDLEPHAAGVAALWSPHTAITDYVGVAAALAADVGVGGGDVRYGARVRRLRQTASGVAVQLADRSPLPTFDEAIVCAGLHADRLAPAGTDDPDPRIVPFRGEYWQLRPERTDLVRGLIYPVPDPRYPFLGIHLTRTIDDRVLVGPNAVLALAREGYRFTTVRARDVLDTLRWPGFRHLAAQHWRTGAGELYRSLSKRAFVGAARRYVPELTTHDVLRAPAGVRAQAVAVDGTLVDDFRIVSHGRVTVVRNAPSPAATSSLAIAEHLVGSIRR